MIHTAHKSINSAIRGSRWLARRSVADATQVIGSLEPTVNTHFNDVAATFLFELAFPGYVASQCVAAHNNSAVTTATPAWPGPTATWTASTWPMGLPDGGVYGPCDASVALSVQGLAVPASGAEAVRLPVGAGVLLEVCAALLKALVFVQSSIPCKYQAIRLEELDPVHS